MSNFMPDGRDFTVAFFVGFVFLHFVLVIPSKKYGGSVKTTSIDLSANDGMTTRQSWLYSVISEQQPHDAELHSAAATLTTRI